MGPRVEGSFQPQVGNHCCRTVDLWASPPGQRSCRPLPDAQQVPLLSELTVSKGHRCVPAVGGVTQSQPGPDLTHSCGCQAPPKALGNGERGWAP